MAGYAHDCDGIPRLLLLGDLDFFQQVSGAGSTINPNTPVPQQMLNTQASGFLGFQVNDALSFEGIPRRGPIVGSRELRIQRKPESGTFSELAFETDFATHFLHKSLWNH